MTDETSSVTSPETQIPLPPHSGNSLEELIAEVDSVYIRVSSDSKKDLLLLDGVSLTSHSKLLEPNSKIIKILESSNYDLGMLASHKIVLLKTPCFVSTIRCFSQSKIAAESINEPLLLIAQKKSNKKVAKKILPLGRVGLNGYSFEYEVHDVIYGFILPEKEIHLSTKLISLNKFYYDQQHIQNIGMIQQELHNEISSYANEIDLFYDKIERFTEDKVSNVKILKSRIESLTSEQDRIKEARDEDKKIWDRVKKDTIEANISLEEAITKRKKAEENKTKTELFLQTMQETVSTQETQLISLAQQKNTTEDTLVKAKKELSETRKELNLYSLDMKGFSAESQGQLSRYYLFTAVLIFILSSIFSYLYSNAKSFEQLVIDTSPLNTLDILLSRLPLITATTLIIGTISALLYFVVNHIITLNKDKMAMLKASILAEQIGTTLEADCKKTDIEILDYKKNLKVELVIKLLDMNKESEPKLNIGQVEALIKTIESSIKK